MAFYGPPENPVAALRDFRERVLNVSPSDPVYGVVTDPGEISRLAVAGVLEQKGLKKERREGECGYADPNRPVNGVWKPYGPLLCRGRNVPFSDEVVESA